MIRLKIAAWLLRGMGAAVQFRVKRIEKTEPSSGIAHINKDGRTVLRADDYDTAARKYKAMRIADTDTITIQLVSTVAQRHGSVFSQQENEDA